VDREGKKVIKVFRRGVRLVLSERMYSPQVIEQENCNILTYEIDYSFSYFTAVSVAL